MPGRGKRLPAIPRELLDLYEGASKADLAEALVSQIACGHPVRAAEDVSPEWLRGELLAAVNAERRARGARPLPERRRSRRG